MQVQEYINSGNLEEYCFDMLNPERQQEVATLALLHPEIKAELREIEMTLEKFAMSQAVEPRAHLRQRLFGALGFAEKEALDINNLPATNKYSDYTQWLNAVEHLIPAEPFEDFFMEVLQHDKHIAQMLVVTKLDVPEELHKEVAESFFILKGQCACTVGNEVFTLNAGDYLDIPLHVDHDIKILSPYVVAILQHQFV